MLYYLSILLEEHEERSPQGLPGWYLHLNASCSTVNVYYSGQHLFLFLVLLKKTQFCFKLVTYILYMSVWGTVACLLKVDNFRTGL